MQGISKRQEEKVKEGSVFFIIVSLTDNIEIGSSTMQSDSEADSA